MTELAAYLREQDDATGERGWYRLLRAVPEATRVSSATITALAKACAATDSRSTFVRLVRDAHAALKEIAAGLDNHWCKQVATDALARAEGICKEQG